MTMTKKEQQALDLAQMRLRELQKKVDTLFGDKPTDTYFSDWLQSPSKDYPLPPGAHIRFTFYGKSITAYIKDGALRISTNYAIQITPEASNVVEIKVREKS
mgnify:FL=1